MSSGRSRPRDASDASAGAAAAAAAAARRPKRARRSRWADAGASDEAASTAEQEAALLKAIALKESPLQAQIEAAKRMAAAARMPMPLMVDDQGRQIDRFGKVIETLQRDLSTTMANRPTAAAAAKDDAKDEPRLTFVDPRIPKANSSRKPRTFKFVEPGQHIRQAQTLRMKQDKSAYRAHHKATAEADADAGLARLNPNLLMMQEEEASEVVPLVEWWDAAVLCQARYGADLDPTKVTALVEHPVPLRPRGTAPVPPPMPMMLTETEKKKMRRMKKLEKQREKQDQIRLGLVPPPEPRMNLKNMTRVLQQQAIEDPTALEAKARAQMEKRQLSHHLHNESRRLTPQQRTQKKRDKLKEDTSREVHVALFRVDRMDDDQNRFKVHVTADQYNLTGCLLLLKDCNIIVVEGGPKGIRKYTKLLTQRIPWNNDDVLANESKPGNDDGEPVVARANKCHLIWRGIVLKRNFASFRVIGCADALQARKQLADKNLVHYWDLAANFSIDDSVV